MSQMCGDRQNNYRRKFHEKCSVRKTKTIKTKIHNGDDPF